MVTVTVSVKIQFGNVRRYLAAMPMRLSKMTSELANGLATGGRRAARKYAPVDSGRLRNAIKSGVVDRGLEKVAVVYVGPEAPYWTYVVRGTAPSPGRYVPAIDRKLVTGTRRVRDYVLTGIDIGMHPGTEPNPFFEEAFEEFLPVAKEMAIYAAREAMRP